MTHLSLRTRLLEFTLKLVYTRQLTEQACSHLDLIQVTQPDLAAGTLVCEVCVELGDTWPNLRMCLVCGYIGCCDTSKNKHMIQHVREIGHPLVRSIEPGEAWIWCYEDKSFLSANSPQLAGRAYP